MGRFGKRLVIEISNDHMEPLKQRAQRERRTIQHTAALIVESTLDGTAPVDRLVEQSEHAAEGVQ